ACSRCPCPGWSHHTPKIAHLQRGSDGTVMIIPVTNTPERLNEEIRRRTYVVRIFPNTESCLRLVRALAVETNENWMEANRYINMDDLREHKKLALRQAA
ncbi:transposase, partial [Mesorhizobium sp. M0220]|uniref:transposase n=1 Tax=Mesorhizobium sp. M0220 TaxID=2956920 RepID=UPI0033374D77